MAHQFDSGAFFHGQTAWHGLGTTVEGTQTTSEAIKTAGMDWTVDDFPMYAGDPGSTEQTLVPGWKVLKRSDNGEVLNVSLPVLEDRGRLTYQRSISFDLAIKAGGSFDFILPSDPFLWDLSLSIDNKMTTLSIRVIEDHLFCDAIASLRIGEALIQIAYYSFCPAVEVAKELLNFFPSPKQYRNQPYRTRLDDWAQHDHE